MQRSEVYDNTFGIKSALYHDLPLYITEEDIRKEHVAEYDYSIGVITDEGILNCADIGQLVLYSKQPLLKKDLLNIINNGIFGRYQVIIHPHYLPQLQELLNKFE